MNLKPHLLGGRICSAASMMVANPEGMLSFAIEACKIQFSMCSSEVVDFEALRSNLQHQIQSSYGPDYKIEFIDAEEGDEIEGTVDVETIGPVVLRISRLLDVSKAFH
ncbi:hypothetical protein [Burkholderia phage BCSR5]|nr:hypothetical protein [Burkholderia phage BCSR5]